MVSSTQSAWIWANSWRWLRIGKPSVLPSVGLQRIRQDLNWTIIATYGEMQCLGLFVIPLIFISATWGQHPWFFFFFFFFDFSHPPSIPAFQLLLWGGNSICWITGFAFPFRSSHSCLEAWNCWWLLHSCLLIWGEIFHFTRMERSDCSISVII